MEDFPILKMKDTLKEIERRLNEKIEADNPRFADEIQEDELKVKQLKRSIAILESNKY
jgi:Ser-tRNA(Ala) deacylase AlaX